MFIKWGINGDLNIQDKQRNTPLHKAVNNLEMAKIFAQERTVNVQNDNKQIPLHVAIKTQDLEVIQFLMDQGSSKEALDKEGRGFMHYLARWGTREMVHMFIKWGVDGDLNVRDNRGNTPLHGVGNNVEMAKIFAQERTVNVQNDNKQIPLHVAIVQGNLEVIQILIDQGSKRLARDRLRRTLSHYIAKFGNPEIFEIFDKWEGITWTAKDKYNSIPLHYVANNEMAKLFLNEKYINFKNKRGQTPLHTAALSGNLEVVQFLVENGADAMVKDGANRSLLHSASNSSSRELIEYLVKELKLNVNAQDIHGYTPLHHVARTANQIGIKTLLKLGADPFGLDKNNQYPLQLMSEDQKETKGYETLKEATFKEDCWGSVKDTGA